MPGMEEIKGSVVYTSTHTTCVSTRYGECLGEKTVTTKETKEFDGDSNGDVEREIAEFCSRKPCEESAYVGDNSVKIKELKEKFGLMPAVVKVKENPKADQVPAAPSTVDDSFNKIDGFGDMVY